jgi:hypothetical protein
MTVFQKTFIILGLTIVSCKNQNTNKIFIESNSARQELKDALTDTTFNQVLVDTVIKDKESAISISETILFKIYGKDNIINQRPYEINFIEGYWILNGTIPTDMDGGTFSIILNATNGQVIKLKHSK